jgi:lipopolysaccharide/colanic/teichoic acid biosynthesis glycosyltransferase
VTRIGRILRKSKIDELPQLLNVLAGQMSFVGPRPDVPGFADRLQGEERLLLSVRPGITGPASLAYRDEEALLAAQSDPEAFNREVIYPDKVQLNLKYIRNYRLWTDLECIARSVASIWRLPK